MRTLRVHMGDILDAITAGATTDGYLDLETGEVHLLPTDPFAWDGEEDRERYDDETKFARIPRTHDEYEWMRELAESIDEDDLRERLLDALSGKGAFRRFKDVVFRYPDVTARWNALKQERALEIALAWLAEREIEPVYELRAPHAPEPPPAPTAVLDLLDLLVLGVPGGKNEIVGGRAVRVARVDPSQARRAFTQLARQICGYHGVEWRKRFVEGKSAFDMEDMHLRVDGDRIRLEIEVTEDERYG